MIFHPDYTETQKHTRILRDVETACSKRAIGVRNDEFIVNVIYQMILGVGTNKSITKHLRTKSIIFLAERKYRIKLIDDARLSKRTS